MTLMQDTVANFIGGVSQQPNKIMLANQSKELINYYLNPANGLTKRPPTEHIARLMNSLSVYPLVHNIMKEDEDYSVFFTGSGINIFDFNGVTKTLNSVETSALSYITTVNPLENLVATTIGDYTFVVNKTKVVELLDDVFTPEYTEAALIFVQQGNYGIDYSIKVNGSTVASYTTSDSDISTTKTDLICTELYNDLVSNLGTTNWNITKLNSCILLENRNDESFTIQTSDSNADRNLYCFYNETDTLSDLPTVAPNGFVIKIIGEDVNTADDYYVQFITADESTFGSGSWQECCAPNIKYKLDPSTMPHALVRESNGTFTFKELEWTPRGAGDETSAKNPSFIGYPINDIFTHKSRLAFLASDKVIFSDTQDIFSFFKKTTVTELDTDPIDVGSNASMTNLTASVTYQKDLLLFSKKSQFAITGGDVFSNSTVAVDSALEYNSSSKCKPVLIGSTVLFANELGEYTRINEIYTTTSYTLDARDITEQAFAYLPKGIYKIIGSTALNMAMFLSTEEPDTIYVYNYYYSGEKKVQSAWSKWVFENTSILNADIKDNFLYITAQHTTSGIYFERIDFTPKVTDYELDWNIHLDRKSYITSVTYDAENNLSYFTKPYTEISDMVVVDENGFECAIEDSTASTIYILGEYTKFCVGNVYESSWKLSEINARRTTNSGISTLNGLLMLKDMNIYYDKTGYFKVTVSPNFNVFSESTFEFTGKVLGTATTTLGVVPISSSSFLVPLMSKNDEIEIEIINDSFLPSTFLSLNWIGDFISRGNKN